MSGCVSKIEHGLLTVGSRHVAETPCLGIRMPSDSGGEAHTRLNGNIRGSRPPANHEEARGAAIHRARKIWYSLPTIALKNSHRPLERKWFAPEVFPIFGA